MSLIGVGALQSRLTAIGNTQGLMQRLALQVVAEQKRLVPRKTGNLGRSIHVQNVTRTSASVIASANYAAFTEYGTRPHEIVPRAKKALRFAVGANRRLSGSPRSGSPVVFAKRVRHPGTRGMHWAQRGADSAIGKGHLADVVIAEWNRAG